MAALCREEDLDDLCLSRVKLAYIFCGNLKTLPFIVERVRKAGIEPFVYMDFIDGLSSKDSAVEFVKCYTSAAGIVTTKSNQVSIWADQPFSSTGPPGPKGIFRKNQKSSSTTMKTK